MSRKDELVSTIVKMEWQMFQNVRNIGGPAACQSDHETFEVMRRSQALSWSEATLESYLGDLRAAEISGRNLVSEKYARMMASTSPLEYERIKDLLPPLDHEVNPLIERIVRVEVKWQEEVLESFPHLVRRGRPIHSSEDTRYVTSVETYLRGELATYSSRTIRLYDKDIADYQRQGKNAAMVVLEHMTKRYGYNSLEEANRILAARS